MVKMFECFSLRDNEELTVQTDKPISGRWIAVMLRTVPAMPGPMLPERDIEGMTPVAVEHTAVIACQQRQSDSMWVWVNLAPQTKEVIGDLLFERDVLHDEWYYVVIS